MPYIKLFLGKQTYSLTLVTDCLVSPLTLSIHTRKINVSCHSSNQSESCSQLCSQIYCIQQALQHETHLTVPPRQCYVQTSEVTGTRICLTQLLPLNRKCFKSVFKNITETASDCSGRHGFQMWLKISLQDCLWVFNHHSYGCFTWICLGLCI